MGSQRLAVGYIENFHYFLQDYKSSYGSPKFACKHDESSSGDPSFAKLAVSTRVQFVRVPEIN